MYTQAKGSYTLHLGTINSIDGSDVARVKIPALLGGTVVTIQPSNATGWTAPVAAEQRLIAVSHDQSDVRWVV